MIVLITATTMASLIPLAVGDATDTPFGSIALATAGGAIFGTIGAMWVRPLMLMPLRRPRFLFPKFRIPVRQRALSSGRDRRAREPRMDRSQDVLAWRASLGSRIGNAFCVVSGQISALRSHNDVQGSRDYRSKIGASWVRSILGSRAFLWLYEGARAAS